MKIYIKNMVCDRCTMAVKAVFAAAEVPVQSIVLGEVETGGEIGKEKLAELAEALQKLGFEIIDDRKSKLIEKIRNMIIGLVHRSEEGLTVKLSDYLADALHYDYNYLSTLFSEVEGIPLEKYFIKQKIERAKELLVYDELSISEIAFSLGYSSAAYFSNQFRQVTGFTPTHFKNIREQRKPLDKL